MEGKHYDKIITDLIKKEYLKPEDRDLYTYALRITVQSILNVIAVFGLGLILNMVKESVLTYITFFFLRKFFGGIHMEKYVYCFSISLVIHFCGLILIKQEWLMQKEIFLCLLFISFVLISLCSPVAHPNKKIYPNEKRIYKTVSIILSIICCLICGITILAGNYQWVGYSIGTSLIISCVLMCIGKIAYRKSNKN